VQDLQDVEARSAAVGRLEGACSAVGAGAAVGPAEALLAEAVCLAAALGEGEGVIGTDVAKNSVPNAGLNPLRPDSGCPLRAGTWHGRPGRAPGRCGCAVTSLLQRGGGGAVC